MRLVQVITDYIRRSILLTMGDLVVRGVGQPERLAAGVAGTVLTSQGVGAIPAYEALEMNFYEPPEGASYVDAADSIANGTVEIYAVPADTIFYLTTANFWMNAQAAGIGNFKILTDAPATYAFLDVAQVAINQPYGVCHIFPIAMQLPAGYSFAVYSGAAVLGVGGQVIGYTRPV